MACKKQGVLFSGTKEQEAALKEVISDHAEGTGHLWLSSN